VVPLDAQRRADLENLFKNKGGEGFRVLVLATRLVDAKEHYTHDDEREMTFRGFLVFYDPPKADVQLTIQRLEGLGIRIKVISGDNRYVTAHLAAAVGLDAKAILTGEEVAKLKDESLWHLAPRTDLFVEIDPQQKERIVRALQRTGHSVGYLGDGINDAPALHAADVGISVNEAVDVARESADIVLLSRDLDLLRVGVVDGRRTFANTLKYITITTSANFGNMISMAVSAPLLPFLPLTAKQILLNNFLSDVPSVAISSDNVDPDRVARPQRWNMTEIQRFMIVFGLISSVFDLLSFAVLLVIFQASEATFQTAWFVISLLTELVVLLVLRTHGSALGSKPGRLLLCSTFGVMFLALATPFFGPVSSAFGFVPLSPLHMAAIVAIVTAYAATTEIAKSWFFAGSRRKSHQLR
jgi:Mg2+-importing ATPase